jgi:hypothetical protein
MWVSPPGKKIASASFVSVVPQAAFRKASSGSQMFATNYSLPLRWLLAWIFILPFVASSHLAAGAEGQGQPEGALAESLLPTVIVIGFVGGFVRHDDTVHQEVQLATHLRKDYASGTEIEIFENRLGRQAHQEILRLLDTDHDGMLSAEEKLKARVVLYGHSWGASEAVTMGANTRERRSWGVADDPSGQCRETGQG